MILKIRRNYGKLRAEVPERVVECDEYERRAYDPEDSTALRAESMFCDQKGEVYPTVTLITYKNEKFANMFLLGYATVFVMNNEGKTVDTIQA